MIISNRLHARSFAWFLVAVYLPPKGLKGFIPVGPRPTESVLATPVHANKELFVNFAEKSQKGGTKAKWKSGS